MTTRNDSAPGNDSERRRQLKAIERELLTASAAVTSALEAQDVPGGERIGNRLDHICGSLSEAYDIASAMRAVEVRA